MSGDSGRRDTDKWISKIMNLWPIILAIFSLIVYGTTIKVKVDDHESRITKLEGSMDRIADNTDKLVEELITKK